MQAVGAVAVDDAAGIQSPRPSLETSEAAFFADSALPPLNALSASRVLPHQLARMFADQRDPACRRILIG